MPSTTTNGHDPGRVARVLLAAGMLAAGYLDYFGYRAQGYFATGFWDDRLHGLAAAPDQYRVGIVWLSHRLVLHLHLSLIWSLASIDLVSALIAVLVLFSTLERTTVYREGSTAEKWFGAASFILLILWFFAWVLWLQKPETLPATMLVALMLRLWQKPNALSAWGWKAALIVALSVLLATFRADMACLLSAGIFLFLLTNKEAELSIPRPAALGVTLLGAVAALTLQLYLMHVVFPQATYGRVKLWQFWPNIKHASRWPPFFLFLLPLLWMMVQVLRRRFIQDAASLAFLTGALCFGVLWVTIGKIDEVRIFLPFALALAPVTAQMAMLRVRSISSSE